MGQGAWWAAVHEVAKSQARPSDFAFFTLGNIQQSAVVPQGLVFGKQRVQSHAARNSY